MKKELIFERTPQPHKVGDRVVLFAKTVGARCYGYDSYSNPYVNFPQEEQEALDTSSWEIVVGTIRAIGQEPLGPRAQKAVEASYNAVGKAPPDRYSPVNISLVQWDGRGNNSYLNDPCDFDLWSFSDFERYRRHIEERAALGEGFKTEELDKVILPEKTRKSIVSVLKQHQHSRKIFEEWGLGEVIEYGRGMTMLFYGPPGTGKTWAATCIARAMSKDIDIIDSSQLQTSEPGGMERNLKAAFAEAKNKKRVLFIDEFDSLVQDRRGMGQILSAEINCLLKEIEGFEGILVLATNRVAELDKALERRISLIVEFPKPSEAERELIWKRMIPSKMPIEEDVDIKVLAKEFDITGGLIKNAVLGAARLAVTEDAEKVKMEHFLNALGNIESGNRAFAQKSSVLRGMIQKGLQGGGLGKTIDRTVDVDKVMSADKSDAILDQYAPVDGKQTTEVEALPAPAEEASVGRSKKPKQRRV